MIVKGAAFWIKPVLIFNSAKKFACKWDSGDVVVLFVADLIVPIFNYIGSIVE